MATPLLPRFVVFQSLGKYLSVTENLSGNIPLGFLKFDEDQIWNPRVKFAVEQAQTGNGNLVHIRSCYNNKYWEIQRVGPLQERMIVAAGKKPVEEGSNDSCTMFEVNPILGGNTRAIRLKYAGNTELLAHHITAQQTNSLDIRDGVAMIVVSTLSAVTEFNVIDWEKLVILPTHVTFRSEDLDGNYSSSRIGGPGPVQLFVSGMDFGDPLVANELVPTPDGNYRIRNLHFGRFWRLSPANWIRTDAEANNTSNDTLFSFVRVSDTIIGLRNLGNGRFCGALTAGGFTDCLNAAYPTLSRQTRLRIEERVLDREISDVRYRLSDSRIYDEEIQEVSHAFATNNSPNQESTVTLKYSITDSRTAHWNNSVSVSIGVSVTFRVTIIPFIARAEVEVSTEIGYTREWGVSKTTERTRGVKYAVVVPPLSSMKVTLMCTKGACDVPFSYTQRDLLTTGERRVTIKDDGIYTGINSYNFYFESSPVSLDSQGRVYL